MIPISAVRFAVKVAQRTSLEQDQIDLLVLNISVWIKYRTAPIMKIGQVMRALRTDGKLYNRIKHLSKNRKSPEILEKVIDFWLAKDIYPDTDITFSQMTKFQQERLRKIRGFIRSK